MGRRLILVLLSILASPAAVSGLITVDFDQHTSGIHFGLDPYVEQGVRLIPECHYHLLVDDPFQKNPSPWFSADSGGPCGDNEKYFPGETSNYPTSIRIDLSGRRFNLLSMKLIDDVMGVESSDGGLFSDSRPPSDDPYIFTRTVSFRGDQWRNLSFAYVHLPDVGAPLYGIDDIRLVAVPSPSTLALFVVAAFVAVSALRRESRRVRKSQIGTRDRECI